MSTEPTVPPFRTTVLPTQPVYCGQVDLTAGSYAVWVEFVWSTAREEWIVTPRLRRGPSLDEELASLTDAAE